MWEARSHLCRGKVRTYIATQSSDTNSIRKKLRTYIAGRSARHIRPRLQFPRLATFAVSRQIPRQSTFFPTFSHPESFALFSAPRNLCIVIRYYYVSLRINNTSTRLARDLHNLYVMKKQDSTFLSILLGFFESYHRQNRHSNCMQRGGKWSLTHKSGHRLC